LRIFQQLENSFPPVCISIKLNKATANLRFVKRKAFLAMHASKLLRAFRWQSTRYCVTALWTNYIPHITHTASWLLLLNSSSHNETLNGQRGL
jgi:hypothetical protein